MTTERRKAPADARPDPETRGFSRPADGSNGLGDAVRRHDPDRFLLCQFVPAALRDAAFTLVAFNHQLARATEIGGRRGRDEAASGLAARIRLQWWREVGDGERRAAHEVATPLATLLEAGTLDRATLNGMVDAREDELDGFGTDEDGWRAALERGPGGLARALGALTGLDGSSLDEAARAGTAYGIGAVLRHLPALRTLGRRPLPVAWLDGDGADAARRTLAAATLASLGAVGRRSAVRRSERAALLHAVLARRDLGRAARGVAVPDAKRRTGGDVLALMAGYATGRF